MRIRVLRDFLSVVPVFPPLPSPADHIGLAIKHAPESLPHRSGIVSDMCLTAEPFVVFLQQGAAMYEKQYEKMKERQIEKVCLKTTRHSLMSLQAVRW